MEYYPASDLAARWHDGIVREHQARTVSESFRDFVGLVLLGDEVFPVYAPEGRFSSVRGLDDDNKRAARQTTRSRLGYVPLRGEYETAEALYSMTEGSVKKLISHNIGFITTGQLDGQETAERDGDSDYALFCHTPIDASATTRSGLLGRAVDGAAQPLVVHVDGSRYMVDVKGAGTSGGYMQLSVNSPLETVVLGGLPLSDARTEASTMEMAYQRDLTPMRPLAAAELDIDGVEDDKIGPLGMVLRLTPSTIRLSHEGTSGSVPIQSEADAMAIVEKLVDNFLAKFTGTHDAPIFVSPASHLENYLVSDGLRITETDFEDWRLFGGPQLPFIHAQTVQFVDTRQVVRWYFSNFTELKYFDKASGPKRIAALTAGKLAALDIAIDFNGCRTTDEVADALWEQWILPIDYWARCRQNYAPDAFRSFMRRNFERVPKLARERDAAHNAQCQAAAETAVPAKPDCYEGLADLRTYQAVHTSLMLEREIPQYDPAAGCFGLRPLYNRERYRHAVHILNEQRRLAEAARRRAPDDRILRGAIQQVMKDSVRDSELTVRVFGGIAFLEAYIASELDYTGRLQSRGINGLDTYGSTLERYHETVRVIGESTDAKTGLCFFARFMPGIVEHLYSVSSEAFSAR